MLRSYWCVQPMTTPRTPVTVYHMLLAALPNNRSTKPLVSALGSQRADVATRTLVALIFTTCGLFALALAIVGLYGVLNYTVGLRMREFATRIALGALPRDLLHIVIRDALVMVLAGTGIGAFGALWFGNLLGGHWLNHRGANRCHRTRWRGTRADCDIAPGLSRTSRSCVTCRSGRSATLDVARSLTASLAELHLAWSRAPRRRCLPHSSRTSSSRRCQA